MSHTSMKLGTANRRVTFVALQLAICLSGVRTMGGLAGWNNESVIPVDGFTKKLLFIYSLKYRNGYLLPSMCGRIQMHLR